MHSFRIDPKDLGVDYEVLRGDDYTLLEKTVWRYLETQHDKPDQAKWENAYNQLLIERRKEPLWLTDNNKLIYRWNYNFIRTKDTQLERKYVHAIREQIMVKFSEVFSSSLDCIIEFGCGSGHNLWHFQNVMPKPHYMGCDFSPSAVALTDKLGIESHLFDMKTLKGDLPYKLKGMTAFTFGAMEQLGEDYHNFTDFITDKFNMGIHIEPIKELYNPYDIYDKLALTYHEKRNYLGNFLTYLRTKNISKVDVIRTSFGNMFNEGYMVVVWNR